MKLTLLAFAAIVSIAPLTSPSSALAGEPNQSSAAASTLTKEERDRAVAYLKETQKDFKAAIDGLSDAQWKFKPAPDKWSVAEVAEHIAVAEEMIWGIISNKIMKSPATPEKRAEVQGKDEIILQKIPDRSRKAQAPEQLKPTGRFANRADLVKAFDASRGEEITYVAETKEDLRNHFEDHPALKTMDAYQWILFNSAHCKRHTAQILEVKADPGFPKS